jgi:hypothetical protein
MPVKQNDTLRLCGPPQLARRRLPSHNSTKSAHHAPIVVWRSVYCSSLLELEFSTPHLDGAELIIAIPLQRVELENFLIDEPPDVLDVELAALKGKGVAANWRRTRLPVLICQTCSPSASRLLF